MKLKETVKYFRFGDSVYLRDTSTFKDYLYNEIVYDILRILSQSQDCSEEQLLRTLSEQYEIEDYAAFCADIAAFLRELQKDGILLPDATAPAEAAPDISREVQRYCEENHRLFQVCMELTYRCNLKCIHCYIDEQHFGQELDFETYRVVIDELADMGCPYLLLTGGEVSLHPAFPDIAEYAAGKGLLVNIYTNGYHLSDRLLWQLIDLHPNSISFSLYGSEPAVHDLVTGIPGSFEKSLRAIMACKCAGIDTFIKTIALKQNVSGLEALFQLGRRLDIPISLAKLVLPSVNGTKQCEVLGLDTADDYFKLFQLEAKYKHSLPQKWEPSKGSFFCSAGTSTLSIDPYGGVRPCGSLKTVFGNVRHERLRDIWERSEAELDHVLPKSPLSAQCDSCEFAEYCFVCPGALTIKDGVSQCNSNICNIAKGACMYSVRTSQQRACADLDKYD